MHRRCSWLLTVGLAGALAVRAGAGIDQALSAWNALGGVTPGRIVRFEIPPTPDGPARAVYSVVFAFDGLLWAYTAEDGSIPLGRLTTAESLSPELITARLTAVAPHISNLIFYADTSAPPGNFGSSLVNGCVIGCIVRMIELLERGEQIDEAGFVFLQPDRRSSIADPRGPLIRSGHAVLVFRRGAQWFTIDPATPARTVAIGDVGLGRRLDPEITLLARDRRYPLGQVSYLGVSARTIRALESEIQWQREVRDRSRLRSS